MLPIKGVSGNIGALDIQNAASDLENALKEKNTHELDALLDRFNSRLNIVLDSIQRLSLSDAMQKAKRSAGPVETTNTLADLLSRLKPYILDQEAKPAKHLIKEITAYTWPDKYAQTILDLNKLISRYNFKEAQDVLSQIMKELGA